MIEIRYYIDGEWLTARNFADAAYDLRDAAAMVPARRIDLKFCEIEDVSAKLWDLIRADRLGKVA